MAQGDWRAAVIQGLGGRVTPQTLSFLQGWQRKEGGHTHNRATWNWLNRTDPGSNYPTMNKVGVAAYPDYQTGVARTVELIQRGYPAIAGALRSGQVSFDNPGVQGDLNRWLSGKRTPGMTPYVQSVAKLAGLPAGAAANPNPAAVSAPAAPRQLANFVPLLAALSERREARSAGQRPEIGSLLGAIMGLRQNAAQGATQGPSMAAPRGALQTPVNPRGTHVTSGLGWGTRTAQDIMARPGTAVTAPVNGRVVYFRPTGAQGGGSMLLRSDDGREYWLGHIANGLPAGTRVRQGQVISHVSADHPRPHLHIDRR